MSIWNTAENIKRHVSYEGPETVFYPMTEEIDGLATEERYAVLNTYD